MVEFNLYGLAMSKFKSITQFAKAIGWSRNKATRILRNIQEPTPDEMCDLAKCLGITSQERFLDIFFAPMTTMWTSEKSEDRRVS